MINLYIVYEIKLWPFHNIDKFAIRKSLFRTVKLTKSADPDKYSYSRWGISFDIRGSFSLRNGGFGKNIYLELI